MKLKQLLLGAALLGAATASADVFDWTPTMDWPWSSGEITQDWALGDLSFSSSVPNLKMSEVMPYLESDEGDKIYADTGNVWWGTTYSYSFDINNFKGNGEYVLVMPEGMLTNADGDLSDGKEFYITLSIAGLGGGGEFGELEVISMTPDLNVPQSLWDNQEFVINTNLNEYIGYTTLEVWDQNPDDPDQAFVMSATNWVESNPRDIGDSSPIKFTAVNSGVEPYKFYAGHNYKATFTFYNGTNTNDKETGMPTPVVATAVYEFEGTVTPYQYSTVKYLQVTPSPVEVTGLANAYIIEEPSQAKFYYAFDGPVTVYKANMPNGPASLIDVTNCLSSNEDKTEWTLDLSEVKAVLDADASITVNIFARDMDGYQLRGNTGFEDNACYQFSWECQLGAPTFTITEPESGANIEQLTKVVVISDSGEKIFWNYTGQGQLWTKSRELLGTLVFVSPDDPDVAGLDSSVISNTELQFTYWKKAGSTEIVPLNITQPGSYSLVFTKSAFAFGEESNAKMSGNKAIGFQIGAPAVDEVTYWEPVSVDPANHSEVPVLSKINLEFDTDVVVPTLYDAYIYDENGNEVEGVRVDVTFDWDNDRLGVIEFVPAITTPGNYSVFIPKGTYSDETYSDSFYGGGAVKGQTNDDMTLYYTVLGGEIEVPSLKILSVNPEDGANVDVLENIIIAFDASFIQIPDIESAPTATVTNAAGVVVAEPVIDFDFSGWNLICLKFATPLTDDDDYTVTIPANVVSFDDRSYTAWNEEIVLHYTIGDGSSVSTVGINGESVIYNLNGRRVNGENLQKGIYIRDGKKVVLK